MGGLHTEQCPLAEFQLSWVLETRQSAPEKSTKFLLGSYFFKWGHVGSYSFFPLNKQIRQLKHVIVFTQELSLATIFNFSLPEMLESNENALKASLWGFIHDI